MATSWDCYGCKNTGNIYERCSNTSKWCGITNSRFTTKNPKNEVPSSCSCSTYNCNDCITPIKIYDKVRIRLHARPIYGNPIVPMTQEGTVMGIRERYAGTPNYYCQYRVYPHSHTFTVDTLCTLENLYELDDLTLI